VHDYVVVYCPYVNADAFVTVIEKEGGRSRETKQVLSMEREHV